LLGVFAKVVRDQRVKTRLQTRLSRQQAEQLYVASLSDVLESCLQVGSQVVLFLQGGDDTGAVADLRRRLEQIGFNHWDELQVLRQDGLDLGERLDRAFEALCGPGDSARPCLIVGADHPSLEARMIREGLEKLGTLDGPAERSTPDVVLGPTRDGGYWGIGARRPLPGLLDGVAWSTERTLQDTLERARLLDLRVELLETGIDIDRPEDLQPLAEQIAVLRADGDSRSGRCCEAFLRQLGVAGPSAPES
jgi:rSAM/selenodomain-associated transferase 1